MRQRNGRRAAAGTISEDPPAAGSSAWLTALRARLDGSPHSSVVAAARLVAAAGLSIDAYVHLDLASTYAEARAPVNEGVLFRAEAVLALLAAVALIISAKRLPLMAGFAVSASALTVMLVSRYVDLGTLGPFPDLYDPVWFAEKLYAAGGEAAATIASVAGLLVLSLRARPHRGTQAAARRSWRGGRGPVPRG